MDARKRMEYKIYGPPQNRAILKKSKSFYLISREDHTHSWDTRHRLYTCDYVKFE